MQNLSIISLAMIAPLSMANAQVGTYQLSDYFGGHLDINGQQLNNWNVASVQLVIKPDLTASLDGEITSPSLTGIYKLHFDFVDPYKSNQLSKPDLNWGNFSGSLTKVSDNTVVANYYDYTGAGQANWGSSFDAAFGVKRPEQGGYHPAPWTNGTAPDGSLEFGFWASNASGQRNGDFNVTVKAVPEPSAGLFAALSGSLLMLRRRRN